MTGYQHRNAKLRVVISKIGLDAHERGAQFVAQGLAREGMEVVYLGKFNVPEGIAQAAVDEGAHVIGLSVLSGEFREYLPKLMRLLREKGAGDIAVVLGGLIPKEEDRWLAELGVKKIFRPGSTMKEIAAGIAEAVEHRRAEAC